MTDTSEPKSRHSKHIKDKDTLEILFQLVQDGLTGKRGELVRIREVSSELGIKEATITVDLLLSYTFAYSVSSALTLIHYFTSFRTGLGTTVS